MALTLLLAPALPGCWQVLEHSDDDDSDDLFMDYDGTLEVSPGSLTLSAAEGAAAGEFLVFTETGGIAGVEFDLVAEGDAAPYLTLDPGDLSLVVVPGGEMEVEVVFTPDAGAGDADAELVATTSGSPEEIRIPVETSVE